MIHRSFDLLHLHPCRLHHNDIAHEGRATAADKPLLGCPAGCWGSGSESILQISHVARCLYV
jgi:hypothetical protein